MKSTFLLLLSVLVYFASCSVNDKITDPYSETIFALGTTCTITVYRKSDEKHISTAFKAVQRVESLMSINLPDSEIAQLNRKAGKGPVSLTEETFLVLKRAKEFARLSDALFDPTVGPLVDLWGIGKEGAAVPDPAPLAAALELVDYRDLSLTEASLEGELLRENMAVDLGGIAKGYAADAAVAALRNAGVSFAIVNLGGNVFALGERFGNGPWRIGIQDPEANRGSYIGIALIVDETVVTSGKYERFFVEEGKRYHHILDTRTGYPVENGLASVTAIDTDSTRADAYSTLIFAQGLEKGMETARSIPSLKVIIIMEDFTVYTVPSPEGWFTLDDDRYQFGEQ
jgi:FAD:protein FMN transferase